MMFPASNQPSRSIATGKTQKFSSIKDVTLENPKSRPIINLRRTYINNASKVIVNYLKPLAKSENTIPNTLKFPKLWKGSDIDDSYEDIPYNTHKVSGHKLRCCYSSNILQYRVGGRGLIYLCKVDHSRISIHFSRN